MEILILDSKSLPTENGTQYSFFLQGESQML